MKKEVAIKVEGLTKKYTIGKQKDASLRGTISGWFKPVQSKVDEFWALNDVSFEVNKGDVVGIIGKNGAGKSTLLKILSRITKPTKGRIEINGRIASLLEVGTGFHPELTGRENIYLNGTILGMTRKEVKAKFDDIVAFSGIEKFIDTPVKHYSSGMYVRLAFAVAAHLEPEILIIDEVLAVGDAEFQKKCLGKMKDVASEGRTVLFVSHNMSVISTLCTKGIYIKEGKISQEGLIGDVINSYNNDLNRSTETSSPTRGVFSLANHPNKKYDSSFGLQEAKLFCDGELTNIVHSGAEMILECLIKNKIKSTNPVLGFCIRTEDGIPMIGIHNLHIGKAFHNEAFEEGVISIKIPTLPLYGQYKCYIDLYLGNNIENYDIIYDAIAFDLAPSDVYKTAKILDNQLNKVIVKDLDMKLNIIY